MNRISDNMDIRAVIFDLDGTLIDTEKLYRKFWPMALKECGYDLSDERALELRSLGRPYAPLQFKKWFGEDFDYDRVRGVRKRIFAEHVEKHGVDIKPGAKELVSYLREKGYTVAIATATDPERTSQYLKLVGLDGMFDELISATMVEHGKPSPEVYQYACNVLGLRPENCMAVEDAPNGVVSAKMAGLYVTMVPDQTEPDEKLLESIDVVVPRIDRLMEIL